MTVLAVVEPVLDGPAAALDAGGARRLTDRIRGALVLAYDLLGDAYAGRAHEVLGYGPGAAGWAAYCAAEFTAEGAVRLPVDQRRAVVRRLRSRGMSTRAIASGLGASEATVRRDLPSASSDADGLPATVTSLDGRRRPAAAAPAAPAARRTKTAIAVESLIAAGADGLTWAELGRRHRWHHGQSSATLSALHRQGRIVRTRMYRDGSAVYRCPGQLDD